MWKTKPSKARQIKRNPERGLWLILGLLPAFVIGAQAISSSDSHARFRSNRRSERQRVLAAIPTDPSVLINVKHRDMPASPDILNLGKRSTKALERCLADNVDANNRVACAVTLHALGDRRALPTLQAAIEDWDPNVRRAVARALGAMPDASSTRPLLAMFQRTDEDLYVRYAALHAFKSISDQRIVKVLRAELRKKVKEDEPDFRPQLFDALWANRHMMARATLIGDTRQALKSDNDSLVLSATYAAAELRAPRLGSVLIPLMEHKNAEIRNKAVFALGHIGDKKATKALLERLPKVREARMLNNIAFALERLDKAAFYKSMVPIIEHKQAIIRLNAAFVLGDVRHGEGLPLLEKALGDASDYVRTSAVVAVGKLGTTDQRQRDRAIKLLDPFSSHSNLSVRQEAIYAQHALAENGRLDLIHDKLFSLREDKHYGVVRRAAMKLAEGDDKRVKAYVVRCVLKHSCAVGTVKDYIIKHADESVKGRLLLAWARGRSEFTSLVAQLNPAGTAPIAKSALEEAWGAPRGHVTRNALDLLGRTQVKAALPLVNQRANTKQTWPRIHSLVAAGRLGDDAAVNKLVREMEDLPAEWFPAFARALGKVDQAALRAKLGPKLEAKQKDKDVNVALAAAAIRMHWDPENAFFRFLEALASDSSYERALAQRYLMHIHHPKLTWVLRRALAREGRGSTRDRLRALLDVRG